MTGPRSTLAHEFRADVAAQALIKSGQRIIVAVSGGLDSCSLLHLMRFALNDLGMDVRAAHFDHAMRPGSRADADWVAGLCRAWDVPLVRSVATQPSANEERARSARYVFLSQLHRDLDADWVLTAHHADDQAETVLFRAIRGAGLRGLAGIPPTRDDWVARPLLHFSKELIAAYARSVGLTWRTDPTNADLGPTRNILRNVILPRLERDVAPGAARSLGRLADRAREFDRTLDGLAEAALSALVVHEEPGRIVLDRTRVSAIPASARAEILRRVAARLDVPLSQTGTRLAAEVSRPGFNEGGRDLGRGLHISVQYEDLVMETDARVTMTRPLCVSRDSEGEGSVVVGGRAMRARWSRVRKSDNPAVGAGEAFFATETLNFPLSIREWRAGDRIRFPYGSKKLKALFQEARLPRWRRTRQPLLVDSNDSVLWVPGVARSGTVRPGAEHVGFWVAVEDTGGEAL